MVACDASGYDIGAVLAHQESNGEEQPIGFVSRTLTAAEKNYSQIEKEALACIFAITKFHTYFYGHKFTFVTDHKPLLSLFKEHKAIPQQASGRIQRWALTLAAYEYTIAFRSTAAHSNADALSRLPMQGQEEQVPLVPETILMLEQINDSPFTAQQVKYFTARDPCLSQVLTYVQKGWPDRLLALEELLKPYSHRRTELTSHDGCLLWGQRVVIPPQGRITVLQELHGGHCGITRMKSLARTVVWEQQDDPPTLPLIPWNWPTRPWSRLHIDYLCPFLGHMWLLIVDAHSKWLEVFPMASTSSSATIQCLRDVFSRFGIPDRIVSDNASYFVSAEFGEFMTKNGIKHSTSAPYHPVSNGLAERALKMFKTGMRKMTQGTLKQKLARLLFSYRTTPHSTTSVSSAELLMNRKLKSALDLLNPRLSDKVVSAQNRQVAAHDKRVQARSFSLGDLVYVRNYG